MANDLIPFKEDGARVTCTTSAAVTGKTLVAISGDAQDDGTYTVAPAGAGAKVFGVAAWDAPSGGKVTVITVPSGQIVPVTAGENLSAGDSIVPEAGGTAVAAGDSVRACGIVLTGADSGDDAVVQLTTHTTNAA